MELLTMIKKFKFLKPNNIAIDTETTGLNIATDVPFLFQFGWTVNGEIHTYVVDLDKDIELGKQTIMTVFKLAESVKYFIGHNINFDLHMLANLGYVYPHDNLTDTQIYIRLAHDALTPANGGPPLSLKEYSAQYITRDAKEHERGIKAELTEIAKAYNAGLLQELRKSAASPPPGYKSWTKGALEALFSKDVIATADDLPPEMREIYKTWYELLPVEISSRMTTLFVESKDIPYTFVNRFKVIEYGHKDIEYTLRVWLKTQNVIKVRRNEEALKLENACIRPLLEMEAVGFQIDKEYINESKERMYNYIKKRRTRLYELAGEKISIGQHARIKELLRDKYGFKLISTAATEMGIILPQLRKDNPEAAELIEIIQELRTLEKWYSTYLMRFVNEMRTHDRVYTQIHQVGTVSGRVTSDFQQFPKYGIKTVDGEELFNPRQMVVVTPGYAGLVYLDYSQIELRVQALYTILVGTPDLNLCRAYMPYKCYTIGTAPTAGVIPQAEQRVEFDYTNSKHLAHAYDYTWYHIEDDQPWHPTDVHAATTSVAFPEIDIHSDEFKKLRGVVGKRVNFAKNYGAQYKKIATMFPEYNFDEETLRRIDNAYYTAFPGVKAYHSYCYDIASSSPYATNLFGVRYYGLSGHKLINCLVQGSSAYFLKQKIVEVQKFLKENNYKTRFQMNIHDEMSFELAPNEEHIIFEIQKIMQRYDDTLVPIVADIEVSTTSWANKKEATNIDDVKELLYRTV